MKSHSKQNTTIFSVKWIPSSRKTIHRELNEVHDVDLHQEHYAMKHLNKS
jgi:hypothetical protein